MDKNAIKIPNTILNWKRAVKRPLFSRGEISEIYIGATTDETPTPNPPINLKNMSKYISGANAEPIALNR